MKGRTAVCMHRFVPRVPEYAESAASGRGKRAPQPIRTPL
eukprot:CAMPEP_0177565602 /NCGR_PEP_ID=MMETSP0369-20130122/74228_1 /TAXON_ID=447022 ORGANISM="Scrippsiella hangoei-like, Strain SHHI-4" /NCGR_SAMPLE_ID=MMETSP0369 /ASSEMBLY_ACC=CAM_ASM_000364 /LENGTH=39 /DNA_ID= /DNA_START= /DNA_END= /DNA_ORIENTATION=